MTDLALTTKPCRAEPLARRQTSIVARHLFLLAVFVRFVLVVGIGVGFEGSIKYISSDSDRYHDSGILIAEQYRFGNIQWADWIDDGWFQVVGLVYSITGPYPAAVMLINAILSGFVTVLIYRIALAVFEDEVVARLSAYIFALFPSVVYFTTLPLKEAASLLGLLSVVWGVIAIQQRRPSQGLWRIVVGVAILTSLRLYLAIVAAGCAALCVAPLRLQRGARGLMQIAGFALVSGAAIFGAISLLGINCSEYAALKYFDLDYINSVRSSLSRGNAAMYSSGEAAKFGQGWWHDLMLAGKGAMYFVLSINPGKVTRGRQLLALPEMLFLLYCIPYIFAGVFAGWKRAPQKILPIVLFAAVIAGMYTSATTNMGALYRWRAQALPFVIMLIVYGATVRRRGVLSKYVRRLRGRWQPEAHAAG